MTLSFGTHKVIIVSEKSNFKLFPIQMHRGPNLILPQNKERSTQSHYLDRLGSTRCCIPSFKVTGLLVPKKKIFKGFYHIWALRPS